MIVFLFSACCCLEGWGPETIQKINHRPTSNFPFLIPLPGIPPRDSSSPSDYWRSVPVSSEFHSFLIHELKIESKSPDEPLLPVFSDWRMGNQATILRGFCEANSIPSIKFHTFRSCFATQIIASGIPATIVMKICGWKDMKTMQRYIRLAGIDESGATERLSFIPTDAAVMEKVVSLFDYRGK